MMAPTEMMSESVPTVARRGRKTKVVTNCKHTAAKHYAKGMCNYCYHVYGRKKYATKCIHKEALVYARDRCHKCYNAMFNKNRKSLISEINGQIPAT